MTGFCNYLIQLPLNRCKKLGEVNVWNRARKVNAGNADDYRREAHAQKRAARRRQGIGVDFRICALASVPDHAGDGHTTRLRRFEG